MFVYRDTSQPDRPATPSPARELTEHDAAYWYDLLAEDPSPRQEEIRGPFEPLVPSNDPDPAQRQSAAVSGTERETLMPDAARDESPDDAARVRARKLEQLKDLYLTAEAIGEHNVDKHFDQLLAQQRELISDYFRQSTGATPPGATFAETPRAETPRAETPRAETPSPGASPSVAGPRDGPAADDTEPGAGVAAERPGAW